MNRHFFLVGWPRTRGGHRPRPATAHASLDSCGSIFLSADASCAFHKTQDCVDTCKTVSVKGAAPPSSTPRAKRGATRRQPRRAPPPAVPSA